MRKKWLWIALSLTVIIVGAVGYYSFSILKFASGIHQSSGHSRLFPSKVNTEAYTPPKWEGKDRVNILLMGGDSRGLEKDEIPRSDSLMVASIDPVTKKGYLLSVMRDTYVAIPGHDEDRVNAALSYGGPHLAMRTVSDLLGIPIQYYVYTDFKGFSELVDAIGGVDIDVEKDMKYTDAWDGHQYDIDLKQGMQRLDGKSALMYVRFRHDALSDFARTERQRKFMTALADKLQTSTALIKLPKILNAINPYIETNLTVGDMLKLGTLGYEVKTTGVVSQQVPPNSLLQERRVGGAEVIGVNPAELHTFIKELFEPGAAPYASPSPDVSNGRERLSSPAVSNGGERLSPPAVSSGPERAAADASPAPAATPKRSAGSTPGISREAADGRHSSFGNS